MLKAESCYAVWMRLLLKRPIAAYRERENHTGAGVNQSIMVYQAFKFRLVEAESVGGTDCWQNITRFVSAQQNIIVRV